MKFQMSSNEQSQASMEINEDDFEMPSPPKEKEMTLEEQTEEPLSPLLFENTKDDTDKSFKMTPMNLKEGEESLPASQSLKMSPIDSKESEESHQASSSLISKRSFESSALVTNTEDSSLDLHLKP